MSVPVEEERYTKPIRNWSGAKRRLQIVFEFTNTILYSFQSRS